MERILAMVVQCTITFNNGLSFSYIFVSLSLSGCSKCLDTNIVDTDQYSACLINLLHLMLLWLFDLCIRT